MFEFLKKKFDEVKNSIVRSIKPQETKKEEAIEVTEIKKITAKKKVGLVTEIKKKIVGKIRLSEGEIDKFLADFELSLLEADVAAEVAEKICSDLRSSIADREFTRNEEIEKTIEQSFRNTLDRILSENKPIDMIERAKQKKPFIILFVGPNGAGKTTTIAKLCNMLQKNGLKCVIAAADTFRAASIEQLEEHAERLDVKVIKHTYGADPTAVAFDAVKYANSNKIDVVLIDSAGRQETNINLFEQIKKMDRVVKPDMKIFVGEAQTGNAIVEQVKAYAGTMGLDGAILSKLDLDVKGGSVLSIIHNKIPILYFCVGQNHEDIKKFDKEFLMKNIFGE